MPSTTMTSYHERHHFPYTPEQMFDLVADVESYPDFVPGLYAAHIRRREGDTLSVDMTVGNAADAPALRLDRCARPAAPHHISSSDPLFDTFEQVWTFAAGRAARHHS